MKIKRRVQRTKPPVQEHVPFGVEYWYTRFNAWTDKMENPLTFWRNFATAIAVVAVMVAGANFLPFTEPVQSYFVVPASLILFLALLAGTRRVLSDDEHFGIRERLSARQRRAYSVPTVILALGAFFFANNYLPYLLGGLLFLTIIFALYNGFRRTPEEIKMDIAGVTDPRDIPVEEDEDINELAYASVEEQLAIEDPFAGGGLINTDSMEENDFDEEIKD